MGLDSAELVMDIEEAFAITFPEETSFKTCGALLDFVLAELRKRGAVDDETVWWKLREMISCFNKKLPPDKITRETRFIEDLNFG